MLLEKRALGRVVDWRFGKRRPLVTFAKVRGRLCKGRTLDAGSGRGRWHLKRQKKKNERETPTAQNKKERAVRDPANEARSMAAAENSIPRETSSD